jgi:hypothetical protein
MLIMNTLKKPLRHLLLAAWTCLLLVTLTTPAFSYLSTMVPPWHQAATADTEFAAGGMLDADLATIQSDLLAQGITQDSMVMYGTVLSDKNVVPNSPDTMARGAVGAILVGDRLVVHGSFSNLSSQMRDYATDPVNPPNADITSAFHIHMGEPVVNGPFQYALDVMTNETGLNGDARGEFTLTAEQLQALESGKLYSDIHTTMNRGGELRGILMPY